MSDLFQTLMTHWVLCVPVLVVILYLIYGWYEHVSKDLDADQDSRLPVYNKTMLMLWSLALVSLACWLLAGGTWVELGFRTVRSDWTGWVSWTAVALGVAYIVYLAILLSGSYQARQTTRDQIETAQIDFMRPRTKTEHDRFRLLSITAGITEEIVFRGFLIAFFGLFAPLWLAAIIAVLLFGFGHIYQGVAGIIRTSLIGGAFMIIFLMADSLWPVIILHIIVDLAAGVQFQLIDQFEEWDAKRKQNSIPIEDAQTA